MPSNIYTYDKPSNSWLRAGKSPILAGSGSSDLREWSDSDLPWAYSSTDDFTANWPEGVSIVDIQTGSGDFYTNLSNTVNAAPGRVVIRLGIGVYHLNQFRMIGSSGDPTYSFGFWFPKLQGFLGQGPDKTFVQMDADSMTQQQLDRMSSMTRSDFAPLQQGFARFDGSSPSSPVLLAGLTFRAEDQNMITHFTEADMQDLFVPQPAPHCGIVLYSNANGIISHVRFQGVARAINSAPPFECANIGSQYGTIKFYNCEFDGRRSAALDAARPRRCGVIMVNNETYSELNDCWLHHSNVSRYAANDENRNTQGQYVLNRCKLEQITNTQNKDPALNGGNSLGGWTNASVLGWESVSGTITLNDCIVSQDNNQTSGQIPAHLQFTSTGSRNPQGGRMYVNGGSFRHTGFSQLDGYVTFRIQTSTYWWLDGYNTTMYVYHANRQRLQPYVYSGTWAPTLSALNSAGISPETHYIIRGT